MDSLAELFAHVLTIFVLLQRMPVACISNYIKRRANDAIPFHRDTVFGKPAAKKQLPDFSTRSKQ